MIAPDDRSMFSQQHLRQLSTSPPPFYGTAMPVGDAYSHFQSQAAAYCSPSAGYDMPLYPQYMPPQPNAPRAAPIKQEYYGEDEMSPFSMS